MCETIPSIFGEQDQPVPKLSARVDPASELVCRLISLIGDNPDRPGLQETPERFMKALKHWFSGYNQDPQVILKTFEDGAESCDQMVAQLNIPVWSHCEHHIAPFFGVAHIAYIPNKKIVGLSKLSRLADVFCRRLQVQERLTSQIAEALFKGLNPKGVGVQLLCRHTCMESRGVQRAGTVTVTSALRGNFLDEPSTKEEFLALVRAGTRV